MKKIVIVTLLVILVLATILVLYFFSGDNYRNDGSSTERSTTSDEYQEGTFLLGKQIAGEDISPGSVIKISPDGRKYWNIVFHKQGARIGAREFMDGNEIRSYTINSGYPIDPHRADIIVSFESQQAGYIVLGDKARVGNEWHVITNGAENGPYRWIGKFSLIPQDKIAYVASPNDMSYLMVGGKQIGSEGIVDFEYSPDGKRLAYVIMDNDKKYHLFWGDKEIAVYGHIKELTFSPDGRKLAYIAREGSITQPGELFVMVNGEKQKSYKFIRNLTFSPDGSKLVYSASDGPSVSPEKSVLNGAEGQDYLWIFQYVFSQDGSKLAYSAQKKLAGVKNESLVILNEQIVGTYPGEEYGEEGNWAYTRNHISNMVFSPDSKHFAYVVSQSKSKRVLGVHTGYESQEFIVVDGRKKEVAYDSIQNLAFVSNEELIRYNGLKSDEIYLVVEGY